MDQDFFISKSLPGQFEVSETPSVVYISQGKAVLLSSRHRLRFRIVADFRVDPVQLTLPV